MLRAWHVHPQWGQQTAGCTESSQQTETVLEAPQSSVNAGRYWQL